MNIVSWVALFGFLLITRMEDEMFPTNCWSALKTKQTNKQKLGEEWLLMWGYIVAQNGIPKNEHYLINLQWSWIVVLKSNKSILITGMLISWPWPHPGLVAPERLMLSLFKQPYIGPKWCCKARACSTKQKPNNRFLTSV